MQRLTLALIRFYRRWLTRYTPRCIQTPCCSAYAENAIRTHGFSAGVRMTLERVRSCR